MSLFEIPRTAAKAIEKYKLSLPRSAQLYLKTPYVDGHMDIPGVVIQSETDAARQVYSMLQIKSSTPILLWHVPLKNVIAVQGVGAENTTLDTALRPIHKRSDSQSRTTMQRYKIQNVLDAYHTDALLCRMTCSPVANTKMTAQMAVTSALINAS